MSKNNNVQVKDLSVIYTYGAASFKAVKNVSFDIKSGEIVGLIGESGSGKTSTAKAILGQIPFFADGVHINGIDIPQLPELKTKKLKNQIANNIQMIYQSPSSSLNPHKRVWKAVAEGMYNIKLPKEEGAAKIDALQEKYVGQIFGYNTKLKSKEIEKLIKEYNSVLKEIGEVNKKKLNIDKENLNFLTNKELVALDKKYNDIIDSINSKINSVSANLSLKVDSAIRNIKKKYKALFENVDINTDMEIKDVLKEIRAKKKNALLEIKLERHKKISKVKLDAKVKIEKIRSSNDEINKEELENIKQSKTKKINEINAIMLPKKHKVLEIFSENKFKVSHLKIQKMEKLNKINLEMKSKIDKITSSSKELFAQAKVEKNELNNEYNSILSEYELERKELIKHILKSDAKKVAKQELSLINKEIKLLKKTNKEDNSALEKPKAKQVKIIESIKEIKGSTIKQVTKKQLVLVNEEIANLYAKARELDATIRTKLREKATSKGLGEEFVEFEAEKDATLKKAIKYARRPFGDKKSIKERAIKLIEEVGLNKKIANSFIPQLSGGQQQRVAIARAFAMKPKFIIADEPIASLDVSLQGSVVNLIKDFAEKRGTAVLFITHDLDMVKRIASRMLVMYRGSIVERGNTKNIFSSPIHPYTKMLMSSSLTIDEALEGKENYIYTGKEHIASKEELKYFTVGKDHEILANSAEVKSWGGK